MVETIMEEMMSYYAGQGKRINHFMKVFTFAQMIGKGEKLDEKTQKILEITALMHDIGIKISEEKYGSSAGHYQEIEGPIIAKKILEDKDVDEDMIERICYIIGHHHTYDHIEGIDYQILVEADLIVNFDEKNTDKETIEKAKDKVFKTKTGIRYLEYMFK